MDIQEIFSKRFNLELDRSGLSKSSVAERIGVNKSTISRYSNGTVTPNAQTLAYLCVLFDCSADYLIGLDQIDNQQSFLSQDDLEDLSSRQITEIEVFSQFQLWKNKRGYID